MPSSTKLLLGVVGCGRVFERYHLPALLKSKDWELAAVCEPLKERREWIRRFYPNLLAFQSYEEFLAEAALKASLITTPPATHFPLSVKALDAGLHVMVEKPPALNLEDGKKLLEASQRNQRKLQIGFNRRFNCHYSELKKIFSSMTYDDIQSISCRLIINPENWNAVTSFYGKDTHGGGVFDDVASHQIDLVPWLLSDNVESVRAEFSAKNGKVDPKSIVYELKLGKGLIVKCLAGHGPKYVENLAIQLQDRKLLAYPGGLLNLHRLPAGSAHGFLRLRTLLHFLIHKFVGKPSVTMKSFETQLGAFAQAVRGETQAMQGADARSGIHLLQTIDACRKSIQSNGSWMALS